MPLPLPSSTEIQEIRDMAESASSFDELKQLVKSATDLAARAVPAPEGKTVDGDDDLYGDDNDDAATDPAPGDDAVSAPAASDDDAPAGGSPSADAPAVPAPVGRRMNKSLSQAINEVPLPAEGNGFDAMPIFEVVGEALLENNAQGFQNHELIKSLAAQIAHGFSNLQKSVDARLSVIEGELATQRPMVKSAAAFVDGIRRAPAGTPRVEDGVPVAAGALMNKGLAGAQLSDLRNEDETLRGLTGNQLIKGLSSRLLSGGESHGLTEEDLTKIGEVPMSELNPKIAEVAAQELGIQLQD